VPIDTFMNRTTVLVELIVVLTLMRALLVAAKVVPRSCARCGVQLERRALGEPVCRCGSQA
jgi:hypothetical protein